VSDLPAKSQPLLVRGNHIVVNSMFSATPRLQVLCNNMISDVAIAIIVSNPPQSREHLDASFAPGETDNG